MSARKARSACDRGGSPVSRSRMRTRATPDPHPRPVCGRVRIGILTKVCTAELVDAAIAKHGRAERRRRLLPAGGGRAARHTGHGLERGGAGCDCSPWTAPNSTFRIRPAATTPSTAPPPPAAFPSDFPRSGQWSWPKSERNGFSTLLAPDPAQPAPSREVRSPLWLALAEISPR
ncbi:transposase domain-containing protein [Streptomyces sp. NPDC048550]|uniref:transposase domain-containing protein n=1 Tax=Streptomyces sp. NPDC048550 TaxID=3155739 RepID=UPI00341F01F2